MFTFFNEEQDPKMKGVKENVMLALNNARKIADTPFKITSGLRSKEENEEIGGDPNSSHLKGLAVDIACDSSEKAFKIIYGAFCAGFKRIGLGKGHIHLDMDTEKPQNLLFIEKKGPNW